MYCTNCGAQLTDNAKFCGQCGTSAKTACAPAHSAANQPSPAKQLPSAPKLSQAKQTLPPTETRMPSTSVCNEKYSLGQEGRELGEFSLLEIQSMISRGIINHETLAWRQGMNEWVALSKVPAIQNLLTSQSSAASITSSQAGSEFALSKWSLRSFWQFDGRIGRLEYFLRGLVVVLATIIIFSALSPIVDALPRAYQGFIGIPVLVAILVGNAVFSFANNAKRWHDLGYSGWCSLWFVLIGGVMILSAIIRSTGGSDVADLTVTLSVLAMVANLVVHLFLLFTPGESAGNQFGLPTHKHP